MGWGSSDAVKAAVKVAVGWEVEVAEEEGKGWAREEAEHARGSLHNLSAGSGRHGACC